VKLWEKYKIGKVYTENNDDKDESTAERLMDRGIRQVESYHENYNKHIKIQDYLYENGFWELIDFDPDTDREYMEQLLDYMEGSEPDDAVDSLACIGRIMIGKKSHNKYTNMFNILKQNNLKFSLFFKKIFAF
jgi:hypothetical protein